MARYILQLTSAAHAGEDQAFNQWYDEVHMPDVLGLPGFLSGQRYKILEADSRPRYLASYEIESDDPQATLAQLFEASKAMVISPTLDASQVTITILEPGLSLKKN